MSDNEQLIRKLRRVYILYRRRVNGNAEAPTDSAGTRHAQGQGKILTALCHGGDGIPQSTLASTLDIRPQSLSEALCRLEEAQLIERRPSPDDKRKTLVYLTEKGIEREQRLSARRTAAAQSTLAPLDETEKKQLFSLLEKILSAQSGEQAP